MIGGGSIAAMVSSLKSNKNLLKKRKSASDKRKDFLYLNGGNNRLRFKEGDSTTINRYKSYSKNRKRNSLLIDGALILITVILIALGLWILSK